MSSQSVTHAEFTIERNFAVAPEQVFAAFADPAKKRRWFAEGKGSDIKEFEMDFRVGGKEHRVSNIDEGPYKGTSLANDTTYQDIVPNRRIVIAYTMTLGDKRISASLATFQFLATEEGTNLVFTEQGAFFEGADGSEMRKDGWSHLLGKLAKELER